MLNSFAERSALILQSSCKNWVRKVSNWEDSVATKFNASDQVSDYVLKTKIYRFSAKRTRSRTRGFAAT